MSQATPVSNVSRTEVSGVVADMIAEDDIKWIAIEYDHTDGGVDFFVITPWNKDPR
jgi:hypothetical protein